MTPPKAEKHPTDEKKGHPPNRRQQDKLINVVLKGRLKESPTKEASEKNRQIFFSKIDEGVISKRDVEIRLSEIRKPTPEKAWEQIKSSPHRERIQKILLLTTQPDINPMQFKLTKKFVGKKSVITLQEKIRDPWKFKRETSNFLNTIEAANGRRKREQYEEAYHTLLDSVYGKQYEYAEQLDHLYKAARDKDHRRKRTEQRAQKTESGRKTQAEQQPEKETNILEGTLADAYEAEVPRRRSYMRSTGQLPITIRGEDEKYKIFSLNQKGLPEDLRNPEAQQLLEKIANDLGNKILEVRPDLTKEGVNKRLRQKAFLETVSPDFNDPEALSFEGNHSREFIIRSEIMRIFLEKMKT